MSPAVEQSELIAPLVPSRLLDDSRLESVLSHLQEAIGLPCLALDAVTGGIRAMSEEGMLPFCPTRLKLRLAEIAVLEIHEVSPQLTYFVFPWPNRDRPDLLVGGYVPRSESVAPEELVLASIELEWPKARFERWMAQVPAHLPGSVRQIVQMGLRELARAERERLLHAEIDLLQRELNHSRTKMHLLHQMTEDLRLSCSPEQLAEHCLNRMQSAFDAMGHAICLEDPDGEVFFLVEGRLPFDEAAVARLLARFDTHHDWQRPLVRNNIEQSLLGNEFPGLQNFAAMPIGVPGQVRLGWILSCNLRDERSFTQSESSLLAAIANVIATHLHNVALYREHEDLVIGFVRSLVSTLDAKDPYTRGHSERVALIARKLSEQMRLPASDIEDVYLSALLHDLGKIGIDDRILRKPDHLSEDEFRQIQAHPLIGYHILQKLKNLQRILPGVRSHHEAYNGRGYPDRLRGEEIPLMARIIAVADSFDAMISDRPYRKGMPLERLEDIFRRGSGEQWDARVIEAYFAARDEIRRIGQTYDPSTGNLLAERVNKQAAGLTSRIVPRH